MKKAIVLLSSYNGEKYISQQLDSIINQIRDFELEILIRDDGSSDNTVSILQKYEKRYPFVNVIYGENGLPIINTIKGDTWELIDKYSIGINYDGNETTFLSCIENQLDRNYNKIIKVYKKYFTKEAFQNQVQRGLEKCSVL